MLNWSKGAPPYTYTEPDNHKFGPLGGGLPSNVKGKTGRCWFLYIRLLHSSLAVHNFRGENQTCVHAPFAAREHPFAFDPYELWHESKLLSVIFIWFAPDPKADTGTMNPADGSSMQSRKELLTKCLRDKVLSIIESWNSIKHHNVSVSASEMTNLDCFDYWWGPNSGTNALRASSNLERQCWHFLSQLSHLCQYPRPWEHNCSRVQRSVQTDWSHFPRNWPSQKDRISHSKSMSAWFIR